MFILFGVLVTALLIKLPNGYRFLIVQTGSMEPKIKVGSVVLMQPMRKIATHLPLYKKGEVITFHPPDNKDILISHRITQVSEENAVFVYQTKGDANTNPDAKPINEANIVGKLTFIVPHIGKFVNFVKMPVGYLIMILIPALYIVISESIKVITEVRKKPHPLSVTKNVALPTLLIITSTSFFYTNGFALFSNTGVSSNNVFLASAQFPISPIPSISVMPSVSPSPTPTLVNHVVINEVFYKVDTLHGIDSEKDRKGFGKIKQTGQNDEWIELYNPMNIGVSLKDWTLTDNSGTLSTIHANKFIQAHDFALISKDGSVWRNWDENPNAVKIELGQNVGDGLDNGGDRLILKNPSGVIVDQMAWQSDTFIWNPAAVDVPEGHSLERNPDGFDTDAPSDFFDTNPPTPGG